MLGNYERWVDTAAVGKNADIIRNRTQKNIFAVVKNNGYNLGLYRVVAALMEKNATHFAVATSEEAIAIKKAFPKAYVLQFNPANKQEIALAREYQVALTICNETWLYTHENMLKGIELQLKINVGMNRFGIRNLSVAKEVVDFCREKDILLTGLLTHFPLAEETDLTAHHEQVDFFCTIATTLMDRYDFSYIHSENTATILQKDPRLDFCNYTRPGILLFGYSSTTQEVPWLLPTLYMTTMVIDIHWVEANEHLGYGTGYCAPEKTKIAVLPIGYGDGLIRVRKEAPVYIHGCPYAIVSKIFMSHMFVAVDDQVQVGDRVEIYGAHVKVDYLSIRGYCTNSEQLCYLKDV